MGSRTRLPARRAAGTELVARPGSSDLRYLEQVVSIQYPLEAARVYLRRHLGNVIRWQLVEAARGETVGVVRAVEVAHADGETSRVVGQRLLANGEPASFYVPADAVFVRPIVSGAVTRGHRLGPDDEVILHVPVQGYLRFLPEIYQGDGPVQSRQLSRTRDAALQRWRSADLPEEHGVDTVVDEDPMRRFLFIFQQVTSSLAERIDHLVDLTDPLRTEDKMLPWLASWVGFELDESLPIHQQRELVRRAIRLMRTRGTRAGIEEMVRVLTSAPVKIEERKRPQAAVLGKAALVGGQTVVQRYQKNQPPGAYLVDPAAYQDTSFFTLRLEPRGRFAERFGERAPQVLRRIAKVVSQERPTHISFVIRFDERKA